MNRPTILERWELTAQELTEIVEANPSMRGLMLGYVAEYKLRKRLSADQRIESLIKYDNHDRREKGDLGILYKGVLIRVLIRVEVKSLQTAKVRESDGVYSGKFQCDASDRREVILPNGERLTTTCLLVGQFDLLAVNLPEFGQKWRFVFARNEDLPRSKYRGYTPDQREYLLATLMDVTWPPQPPFVDDPFPLFDRIVHERTGQQTKRRS